MSLLRPEYMGYGYLFQSPYLDPDPELHNYVYLKCFMKNYSLLVCPCVFMHFQIIKDFKSDVAYHNKRMRICETRYFTLSLKLSLSRSRILNFSSVITSY